MAITSKKLTLEQFLRLPEKKPALEYEEGRITQKPLPRGKHSVLQFKVADAVNRLAAPPRIAMAFPELRFTYEERSYVPDVSVYRYERIPRDASGEVADDFFIPPDIAIEILSLGQSLNALIRKCAWYTSNGVAAALLVSPADRSVRLFLPGQVPRALLGQDPIDLGDLLPGFRLTVEQLFQSLRDM